VLRNFQTAGASIQIVINIPKRLERPILLLVLLYRRIRYGYAFRKIPLTRGKFAVVDPEDYERLSLYKWHAFTGRGTYYAMRIGRKSEKRSGKRIWMHREILNLEEGLMCDHINHNGLDNRSANLRPATHRQNMWNHLKRKTRCGSKYKGIDRASDMKHWRARIRFKGKRIYLGSFENEIDAAKAYDEAAKKYYGQYAALNFPVRRRCAL